MAPVLRLQVVLFYSSYFICLSLHIASVELKTDRLDLVLDFCQMLCDSAALPFVQALVIRVADDFLKRISTACPHFFRLLLSLCVCFTDAKFTHVTCQVLRASI
jgi:hypothetical protein